MTTHKRAPRLLVRAFLILALGLPLAQLTRAATHCAPGAICADPPLVTTDGELAWRYIGRMPLEFATAPCPAAPGWSAAKAFPNALGAVPLVLQRYCVYTADTPADPSPPVPQVSRRSGRSCRESIPPLRKPATWSKPIRPSRMIDSAAL